MLNPRPNGAGGSPESLPPGPTTFLPKAKKRKEISPLNFAYPFFTNFTHLNKGIFQGSDRSVVNDVKATSCSTVSGQKQGCVGIVTSTVLKKEMIGFQQKM